MATYQTYTAIGMREDLSDVIYSISPTDVPFMSSIGKTKATAVLHEWQTDSLAAASLSNYAVEGATASISSIKIIAGAFCLACAKRSRTLEAPTPTNISTNSDPEIE